MPERTSNPATYLRSLFDTAIGAADPSLHVATHLPDLPKGRVLIVAAGKAAASMARAAEEAWQDVPLTGLALCPYGHGVDCERIEVIEAAHPVPDNRGEVAAQRILTEVEALGAGDLLLFLVSGGGSSLLALPADGVTLADKAAVNKQLLRSGAPISAMNAVRKRLSAIKGGRLAVAAWPAPTVTLAISDVPGDDLGTIASGPTIAEHTTRADVDAILSQYAIDLPPHVAAAMQEPPSPQHPAFAAASTTMIAKPADMIEAVVALAQQDGHSVVSLGADMEGESRDVARNHAAMIRKRRDAGERVLIVSGGETTVTVKPGEACGRGGRNTEYLLALALELDGMAEVWALAADTDGIDGAETIAGAMIGPTTLERAKADGLDPTAALAGHDSATLFRALRDEVETGPTRTNVNDCRVIWVG